jgi:hypothetical protein
VRPEFSAAQRRELASERQALDRRESFPSDSRRWMKRSWLSRSFTALACAIVMAPV